MLSSLVEVINGTILAEEVNQTEVSFAIPPELKEMLISFIVVLINCAGRSFSEPVDIGKVFKCFASQIGPLIYIIVELIDVY